MDINTLEKLLNDVKSSDLDVKDALKQLETLPFSDLGFAKIDNHRELRVGYPEVIYGEGKTVDHVVKIVDHMNRKGANVLVTRCSEDMARGIMEICHKAEYNPIGRTVCITNAKVEESQEYIAIVAAGTSDLPVVEEAYETARILGNKVKKITDVGVAGIHRLFANLDDIRGAKVVIVAAGMEGALASVLGGLVNKPIIAVPTSVGYGANFGGLAALLSMLNSCASGVSVVNIDNGFGAAYNASIINKL
ncbi:nickel pincer cofactor biosynthesis protein LarB [Fusibacter sp. JL216-2]|uniref:nickel pincer cofactor biosynthesis protein LarB n=1 Tax=Fusibacter sp. JL216-2 TaxID=3071453 RepID=UPI003D33AC5B